MDTSPLILLAAGGTGGHLFPAEALGVELIRRGFRVRLATDARALRYGGLFSRDTIDVVPSETVRSRSPWSLARTGMMLGARHRGGARSDAAAEASRRGRLRRLSDAAAAARGTAARRARHHPRSQRGARPRQPFSVQPRQRDRDLAAGRARSRSGAGGKTTTVGTPMRPAILAAAAVNYVSPEPNGPFACWWSAAARARG